MTSDPMALRRAAAPGLVDHRVGSVPDRYQYYDKSRRELDYCPTVPQAAFSAEMQCLVAQDHQTISIYRLADLIPNALPLPAHPAAITFDHGFANDYQHAHPVQFIAYSGLWPNGSPAEA